MKQVLNPNIEAGLKESNEPRLLGQIWSERLVNGNDNFIVAYRQHLINSRKEVVAL